MKNLLKIISLSLLLCMLVSVFASCGKTDEGSNNDDTANPPAGDNGGDEGGSTELKASLKDEIKDWTLVEIKNIEVKNNELGVGIWLKGAKAGQFVYVDRIQVKEVGKGNATGNMGYLSSTEIANNDLSSNAYTTLMAGGYVSKTKLHIGSDTEDFKGMNSKTFKELPDGTYTLRAYVRSSGGHSSAHLVANSGSDSSTELKASFAKWEMDDWTLVEVTGIKVMGGKLMVGTWVNSKVGNWIEIDGMELLMEGGDTGSPDGGQDRLPITVAAVAVIVLTGAIFGLAIVSRKKKQIKAK